MNMRVLFLVGVPQYSRGGDWSCPPGRAISVVLLSMLRWTGPPIRRCQWCPDDAPAVFVEDGVGLSIQRRRGATSLNAVMYMLLERTIHIPRSLVFIGSRREPPAIENDLKRAG